MKLHVKRATSMKLCAVLVVCLEMTACFGGNPGPGPGPGPGPQPPPGPIEHAALIYHAGFDGQYDTDLHPGVAGYVANQDPTKSFNKYDNVLMANNLSAHCDINECNYAIDSSQGLGSLGWFIIDPILDKNQNVHITQQLSDQLATDQWNNTKKLLVDNAACTHDKTNDSYQCYLSVNITPKSGGGDMEPAVVPIEVSTTPEGITVKGAAFKLTDTTTDQYNPDNEYGDPSSALYKQLKNPLYLFAKNNEYDTSPIITDLSAYFRGDVDQRIKSVKVTKVLKIQHGSTTMGGQSHRLRVADVSSEGYFYCQKKKSMQELMLDTQPQLFFMDDGIYQVTLEFDGANGQLFNSVINVNYSTSDQPYNAYENDKVSFAYAYLGANKKQDITDFIATANKHSINTLGVDMIYLNYVPVKSLHQVTGSSEPTHWPIDSKTGSPNLSGIKAVVSLPDGMSIADVYHQINKAGLQYAPVVEMSPHVKATYSTWSPTQRKYAVRKILCSLTDTPDATCDDIKQDLPQDTSHFYADAFSFDTESGPDDPGSVQFIWDLSNALEQYGAGMSFFYFPGGFSVSNIMALGPLGYGMISTYDAGTTRAKFDAADTSKISTMNSYLLQHGWDQTQDIDNQHLFSQLKATLPESTHSAKYGYDPEFFSPAKVFEKEIVNTTDMLTSHSSEDEAINYLKVCNNLNEHKPGSFTKIEPNSYCSLSLQDDLYNNAAGMRSNSRGLGKATYEDNQEYVSPINNFNKLDGHFIPVLPMAATATNWSAVLYVAPSLSDDHSGSSAGSHGIGIIHAIRKKHVTVDGQEYACSNANGRDVSWFGDLENNLKNGETSSQTFQDEDQALHQCFLETGSADDIQHVILSYNNTTQQYYLLVSALDDGKYKPVSVAQTNDDTTNLGQSYLYSIYHMYTGRTLSQDQTAQDPLLGFENDYTAKDKTCMIGVGMFALEHSSVSYCGGEQPTPNCPLQQPFDIIDGSTGQNGSDPMTAFLQSGAFDPLSKQTTTSIQENYDFQSGTYKNALWGTYSQLWDDYLKSDQMH